MEPAEIRTILINAMRVKVAEAVINSDTSELAKCNIAITVVSRLSDEEIEKHLVDLFAEAVERTNFVLKF